MTQSKVEEVRGAVLKVMEQECFTEIFAPDGGLNAATLITYAAIAAMRNPTPDMKAAGAKSIPEPGNYDFAHDAYVNMIDAALEE